ncbi:MAG: hypothetical protein SFW09_14140 [Hyphomicrobiaceae bacterium]|nr:hypothetical protein [Hyphomicrobiaceae bacterium]
MLVSHWQVDSEAAVRLTTGTFAPPGQQPDNQPREGPAALDAGDPR